MNRIKVSLVIFCCMIAFKLNAQTDKKTTTKLIAAKRFTFVASNAIPQNTTDINNILSSLPGSFQNGANISLTGGYYDVKVTPDSVTCYLPYYGRAYNAPMHPDENGYKFTSTKFDYQSKNSKKRGWYISINSKDIKDNPQLTLSVSESGYATLSVVSANKQSISYQGYLKENQ